MVADRTLLIASRGGFAPGKELAIKNSVSIYAHGVKKKIPKCVAVGRRNLYKNKAIIKVKVQGPRGVGAQFRKCFCCKQEDLLWVP